MKTSVQLKSTSVRNSLAVAVFLFTVYTTGYSQEPATVFKSGAKTGYAWGLDLKTLSIQQDLATQFGAYTGIVFGHSTLLGITGAMNVTHPKVNYGYLGVLIQYTYKPNDLLHVSGQLTLGTGDTKDYEDEKSSIFDNLGNVTGARFYLLEPVINGELNLGLKTRLVLGVGYRYVNGINQNNEEISRTHVSDSDMSGFCVTAGIKFGLY